MGIHQSHPLRSPQSSHAHPMNNYDKPGGNSSRRAPLEGFSEEPVNPTAGGLKDFYRTWFKVRNTTLSCKKTSDCNAPKRTQSGIIRDFSTIAATGTCFCLFPVTCTGRSAAHRRSCPWKAARMNRSIVEREDCQALGSFRA